MTIKQQGGVFGRNPTFNNVDVEGTLTVNGEPISDFGTMAQQDADSVNIDGGAIDGVTLGTNSAVTDARIDNIRIDGNTISSTDTNGDITLDPNGTGRVVVSQSEVLVEAVPGTTVPRVLRFDRNQGSVADIGQLQFYTFNGVSVKKEYGRITGAATRINNGIELGEVYISTTLNGVLREAGRFTSAGNLAFPSGQGIDFSATAGTGTSELLDDYEEGTWTPVIDPGVSYTGTLTLSGNYTKIGRLVWVNFRVVVAGGSLSSSAGALLVTGIPFSGAADSVGGYGSGQTLTGGATITPYVYTAGVALAGAVSSVTSIYGTAAYSAA